MSQPNRHPSDRQSHGHSYRRSTTPQAVPQGSSPYHTNNPNQYNHNQYVRGTGTSSPTGWSSRATQGSVAYPQGSRSPQRGGSGLHRSDTGAYTSTFRQQGNPTPSVLQNECRAWFFAIDQDGDGTLSSEELRSALLNNGGLRFSVNTVKYLMGIFDSDGNDVITYDEFEPLWFYMNENRQMFDSFDRDRDGRIDAAELASALAHYNIRVGPHVLEMLVRKYGMIARNRPPGYGNVPVQPRPQMDLDQFVCATVVVRQMCDLYEKCKAGGRSQISRDEFLRAVISLP